jgi:hypothetical protein
MAFYMKKYVHLRRISLKSSSNEKYFRQILYKKSKHAFYAQISFQKPCLFRNNVEKYGKVGDTADNYTHTLGMLDN